ncbi:hypothetical protein TNCV_3512831 [Trichonephila clavipes]|nr:hypothetical protein TNCV_3512831 [Trichonephila clavipes]
MYRFISVQPPESELKSILLNLASWITLRIHQSDSCQTVEIHPRKSFFLLYQAISIQFGGIAEHIRQVPCSRACAAWPKLALAPLKLTIIIITLVPETKDYLLPPSLFQI